MWEIGILYLCLGAVAGTVAGLLGVGGGLIIVPVLALVFQRAGIAPELIMHLAIGTSLATIVLTSISSVRAHHRRGAVLWPLVWRLSPGIVIGALLGAEFASVMQSQWLSRFFGVFELLVAVQMALGLRPSAQRGLPGTPGMVGAGGAIGGVSAIVGIGGGTLTVPFLSWCGVQMRNAVGTSSACGLPIAVAGALGFVLTGWGTPKLPAWSTGYVYWPAFLGIVTASVAFAPLGAALAHRLPAAGLKRVFAVLLALIGVRFLLGLF